MDKTASIKNEPTTKDPRFFLASGELTPYALECGYIQIESFLNGGVIKLDKTAGLQYYTVWGRLRVSTESWQKCEDSFIVDFQSLREARSYYKHKLATMNCELADEISELCK